MLPWIKNPNLYFFSKKGHVIRKKTDKELLDETNEINTKKISKKRKSIISAPRKKSKQAAFNQTYACYKQGAKTRGHVFHITKEDFLTITQLECFYCGSLPSNQLKARHSQYIYNGIDRLNSDIGYIKENIVPCCRECNLMKRTMSYDYFIKKIITILNHTPNDDIKSLICVVKR